MNTGPSATPAIALQEPTRQEQAAVLRRSLLAIAEYATQQAERLEHEARARVSLLLPLTWLLAGRGTCRTRRCRLWARVLHALADLFVPAPVGDLATGSDHPAADDRRPAAQQPRIATTAPAGARAGRIGPQAPPARPRQSRPHVTRRLLPRRPRLLPPPQAAPFFAHRPRA